MSCEPEKARSLMRPTIPLGPWRLAIDLAATRAVNALDVHPARGCTCEDCQRWAQLHDTLLPSTLAEELRRIGIDPALPSDTYGTDSIRVTYHCVGRILSGPPEFSPESGAGRHYESLTEKPGEVALAVAYQASIAPAPPAWATAELQPLIAIDFWFLGRRSRAEGE
jgi:hypothetical protein